jgi:predicted restriction endonuclease
LIDGFFLINGYSNDGKVNKELSYGPFTEELKKIDIDLFAPDSQQDARDRVLKQIIQRQGQKKFRESLLKIYNSTCVITKCNIPSVLEAAHITPYLGPNTNKITNGLILRADIHTLWDLGLIAIEPKEMKIHINPILDGSEYQELNLRPIDLNLNEYEHPSKKALEVQWELFLNKKY